jgi:hypothetical protein
MTVKKLIQTLSNSLKLMPKLSSQLRIEMTANNDANIVKTEVKKQDSASVKWNGPRTAEGRQRIAQAQLKHGAFSKAGIEAKQAEAIQLRQLEDIAVLIGMITGPRTRGCKPRGYKAIRSMEAVKALVALE